MQDGTMRTDIYLESIRKVIDEEKNFNIKFYVIDDEIEGKIETALNLIFGKFNHPELAGVAYTCVKELLINGSKANIKRALFGRSNLNIDNEDDYVKGMMEFRNELYEENVKHFLQELRSQDLWVTVRFEYKESGARITVINNAHITELENKRLREKLKKAMSYEDIVQFYIDQGDEMEGAGMGIALIVMLLKGLEIDPGLFRIGNTEEKTTFARLEIPLNENYQSVRQSGSK